MNDRLGSVTTSAISHLEIGADNSGSGSEVEVFDIVDFSVINKTELTSARKILLF